MSKRLSSKLSRRLRRRLSRRLSRRIERRLSRWLSRRLSGRFRVWQKDFWLKVQMPRRIGILSRSDEHIQGDGDYIML